MSSASGWASPEFRVNVDYYNNEDLEPILAFDTRAAHPGVEEDRTFWTIYLLNAYHGLTGLDGDGNDDDPQAQVGFTPREGPASFIFVEPAGTKECNSRPPLSSYTCDVRLVTAREVAKALGAREEDGGLLGLEGTVLSEASLSKIRENQFP